MKRLAIAETKAVFKLPDYVISCDYGIIKYLILAQRRFIFQKKRAIMTFGIAM